MPRCLIQVRQCNLTSQACELKASSWCGVTDSTSVVLWIPAPLDPDTPQKPGQTPVLKGLHTVVGTTSTHCTAAPWDMEILQERFWRAPWRGEQDHSWCAWVAWAGKDRERQRGAEGRNEGGRCWPDPPVQIHSHQPCLGMAALGPCVLCRQGWQHPKSSFQGKGLALRQDLHFFFPAYIWCQDKNSFTVLNGFFFTWECLEGNSEYLTVWIHWHLYLSFSSRVVWILSNVPGRTQRKIIEFPHRTESASPPK